MSTLLEQASLVMIPSGYKEDVVYSQIPTDGSGDLTFTRASNGTRVNSAGLVEVCPWNLAQQSNTFGTSPWSNTLDTGATLTYTANYGTAPDGTTTAGRLQMALNGSAYAQKNQIISVITGQQYTYSVYMRSLSGTKTIIFCYDNTNNISATVTTEWQRFTHTFTGNSQVYARFVLEAGTSTSVDLLIYGAQLNIGSTAKPYFPTTDRLNVPRLTYQNGGGGCPSLLLEKQSTNLTLYSEQLGNAAWNKINVSVSANQAAAPDGTTSADLIYPTTTGDNRLIEQFFAAGAGQTWTTSFFVKASGFSWVIIYAPTGGGASWFNASTGVFGTIAAGSTAAVLGQVNGFWRISITATLAGTNTYFYAGPADANGSITATANGTNGLLIWGCQLELSSYATSYIPTTSSSATRVADAFALKDITSFSIGNAYTILLDVTMQSSDNNKLFFETRTSTNATSLTARNFNGALRLFNNIDASYPLAAVSSSTNKWVVRINGTSYDLFAVSGGIATKDSATITTARNFGYFELAGSTTQLYFDELVISPTALTDAECQSLVL